MPLLDRQVRNILAFVNSSVPLDAQAYFDCGRLLARPETLPSETKALQKLLSPCHAMIGSDMPGYFMETDEHVHNAGLTRTDRPAASANADIAAYQDLFSIAQDIAATGLSCGTYRYAPHVPTGSGMQISARRLAAQTYEPTRCFLWLGFDPAVIGTVAAAGRHMSEADQHAIRCTPDLAPDWAKGRTCNRLTLSQGYPHIGTFFDTPGYLIKTSPARLYALSNYTAWLLEKHTPRIRDAFAANGLKL